MNVISRRSRHLSQLAAWLVTCGGLLVLLGWWFDIQILKQPLQMEATMKANTAAGFAIGGLAVAFVNGGSAARRLSMILAMALALLGFLSLAEFAFGWNLGIDQVLAIDRNVGMRSAPGLMAPGAAAAFVAIGGGLVASGLGRDGWPAQGPFLFAATAGSVGAVGYLFGAHALFGPNDPMIVQRMAVHTAVLLIVLAVGALLARPAGGGAMAVIMSDTLAGARTRQLLPFAILIPVVLGWIRLEGQLHGVFGVQFGAAFVVVATIAILSVAIWSNAATFYAAEARHRQAEDAEHRLNMTLEQRVAEQTERLSRSEAASRRAEERFRQLLELAPDAMVIADARGRIALVNAQTEKLFGYQRADLLGQPIDMLVPDLLRASQVSLPEGRAAVPGAGAAARGIDLFGVRADGSELAVEINVRPLETADEGIFLLGAIRDISERKRLESDLKEASRLKSEHLAHMSHELRTPLNAVIGFASLMYSGRAGEVSPDHKEYLGDILTSSRHLLDLMNDILDLAKVESGVIEFRPERVDVRSLVTGARDLLRGLAAAKHLTVDVSIDLDVATVVSDPARLKQILYNYLSNAIKFTPDGGRIAIRAVGDGPQMFRLEVEDNGAGIAEENLPRLFTEFQQFDPATGRKQQGTGLGLALTKRLAEAQGGRVTVRSAPGHGSTFAAILPRRLEVDSAPSDRASEVAAAPA